MKIKQELLRHISPSTSAQERLAVAKREEAGLPGLPGLIDPSDEVTVLFVLGFDKDPQISGAAKKSLAEYPVQGLLSALEERLDPIVIRKILETRPEDEAIRIMAALNPGIDDETLKRLAETGPAEVVAALSEDGIILARKPFIAEALLKNPNASRTLAAELEEARAKAAPVDVKKEEPAKLHMDLVDDKRAKADEQNIFKLITQLSMGQKLKLALSGNKSARDLLVKDSNRIISNAVLKNPRITEEEIQKVTQSKGTNDDMLRHISRNKEWMKSYTIRLGMLGNPKTPLSISLKLLDSVYEKDLHNVSKSKSIPSTLASAARRKLESKGKKS